MSLISYSVPAPGGRVVIDVYDVSGRHVASLVDHYCEPGWFAVGWNGSDDSGQRVAAGVYFCRMVTQDSEESVKLILLK